MNLHESKRPVLIFGAGIHQCHAEREARGLAELLQIPVCLTWGAADLLPESNPLRIGTFGTHGTRAANFAVQNADYLLCIGTRLDTKATGTPAKWFAREAHIVMVDIDESEIAKMEKVGVKVEGVCEDAKTFIQTNLIAAQYNQPTGDVSAWLLRCQDWKRRYPAVLPEYEREEGANPYVLIRELSRIAEPGDIIVSDTGCAIAWVCQAWEFKEGQRLLHPWNQTPMGYGLPAAIGAHYATGKRVICITGDGSIMMSIGELATIGEKNLPIRVLLLNNNSHAMCVQTEQEHFGGKNAATTQEAGLSFPDFYKVAKAFGFRVEQLYFNDYAQNRLAWLLDSTARYPRLLRAKIDCDLDVRPKVKFGYPNEDGFPYLPREVLAAEMIVSMVECV